MGFKETRTYFETCISRLALAALSALPPGVINCVCVYPVVYTVITGKYSRSNINNSCLVCSLIRSNGDGGRIM